MSLLQVAKIKRSEISPLLQYLDSVDEVTLTSRQIVVKQPWYTATLPANFSVKRTKDENGDTRLDFQPHPSVSFSVLHQDCNAIVILKDRINVELPNFPDAYIAIKED